MTRVSSIVALIVALALGAAAAPDAQAQTYRRWYLAEGAANGFFNDTILIGNPSDTAATVTIRLLPEGQPPFADQQITVPATSRYTFNVNAVAGLPPGAVSAIVESANVDIVVERSMTWPGAAQRGGHNSGGVLAPAATWYLAEGVTGFFETFVLITNTSATTAATVEVTFLREVSGPLVRSYTLPANGRRTIYVNADIQDAQGRPISEPFSTVVRQTNGADLVVERAMYWNAFEGGHGSAGVTAPSTTWLFAEGVNGGDASFNFQTYLLLANPGATAASATITFFRDQGGPVSKVVPVPAGRRVTLPLFDLRFGANNVAELANASFSIRVASDQPVLAERAVYWSSSGVTFIEGHNSPGVTAEATKWAFAEGIEGVVQPGGPSHDSYFLISNANAQPLTVKATFVREDGHGVVIRQTVQPQSRGTILTSGLLALSHQRFAAFLESDDATPLPFVAERATYWGAGYYGGHGATGIPWTGTIATPTAPNLTPQVSSISPSHGPLGGGTDITIRGVNFTESTTVTIGDRPAQVFAVDATTLVATVPAGTAPGSVAVTLTNAGFLPVTMTSGYTYDPVGPFLFADNILSFGDSITEGRSSRIQGGIISGIDIVGYPQRMLSILQARYPTQAVRVENAGRGGECASASCPFVGAPVGQDRLPTRFAAAHDLVILLEGTNDITFPRTTTQLVDALRTMISTARAAGKSVLLSGLWPVKPREDNGDWKGANPSQISLYNGAIQQLAIAEAVPYIDMVARLGPGYIAYLSPDGLHPNEAGYQRMAEIVADAVVQHFAIP
jgi:lysophospholipase L1-like esterase